VWVSLVEGLVRARAGSRPRRVAGGGLWWPARTLRGGYRRGGPEYVEFVVGWPAGALVVQKQVVIFQGATPRGTSLPEGKRFEQVFTEKNGKLVKIREGVVDNPQP